MWVAPQPIALQPTKIKGPGELGTAMPVLPIAEPSWRVRSTVIPWHLTDGSYQLREMFPKSAHLQHELSKVYPCLLPSLVAQWPGSSRIENKDGSFYGRSVQRVYRGISNL